MRYRRLRVFVPHSALVCTAALLWSLNAGASDSQSTASLAQTIKRADTGQTELHIFYVHGIGINPPKHNKGTQRFETSEEFRTSFCKLKPVHCTNKIKDQFEGREYAHTGPFAKDANPPHLFYLGEEEIWRTKDPAGNPSLADWRAAAPFVDHYRLLRGNAAPIHLHEINWWPLVLSAKCRQIVAKEAALIGPDDQHIEVCKAKTEPDGDVRFRSYQWITDNDVLPRNPPSPGPAPFNRGLKAGVLDWGFADAILALDPRLRGYLVTGIREVVRDTYVEATKGDGGAKCDKQEFVVVSHSLGSYLMFSALDLPVDAPDAKIPEWKQNLDDLLSKTSHSYFMANQIRLLELANLDDASKGNLITHLQSWSQRRAECHSSAKIDAFSDPSDWLTWQVPDNDQVTVINHSVKNAWHWFWYIEGPAAAHLNYDKNKQVLRAMLPKQDMKEPGPIGGASKAPTR
jgi:hypothetical protein